MEKTPLDFYQELSQDCTEALGQDRKQYNRCSFLRGVAMLCVIGACVAGYVQNQPLFYGAGALALLAFVWLIGRHSHIVERQTHHTALRDVAKAYLDRSGDGWKDSPVDGAAYLSEDYPPGRDLDLFGKDSLYQYICAASTPFGRDCLADWLKRGCGSLPEWNSRREAVEELAEKQHFSAEYQAFALPERDAKKGTTSDVWDRFLHTEGRRPVFRGLLLWVLPVLTLLCLFSALLGFYPQIGQIGFSCLALVQLGTALLCLKGHNQQFGPVYRFHKMVLPYRKLAARFAQETFVSGYLRDLQDRLQQNGGAQQALKELEQISGSIAARHNGLALLLYNALFLYDFHCAKRLYAWKKAYGPYIQGWLEALGEVEALLSLGVLSQVKAVHTFPELRDAAQPFLDAQDLRHPLIPEERAAGNDFSLRQRTCIITGSNMSGKTTFLRTVGTNLILAFAGGAVAAKLFCASPMAVCTSIRVEDSVSEGISSFYAELLRVKTIIDRSQSAAPMIALIDEIYRGTNSRDRIIGARETIRRLARPNVLTLVTTHDFELCDLENDPRTPAVNYHFTEHYSGREIRFDYRIRPGRCRTTNAQHLLRLVGILPEEGEGFQ